MLSLEPKRHLSGIMLDSVKLRKAPIISNWFQKAFRSIKYGLWQKIVEVKGILKVKYMVHSFIESF